MVIHQPSFQLIFNVIAITAVTSLATICNILKNDKERLSIELHQQRNQNWQQPVKVVAPAAAVSAAEDIRQFVATRAQIWTAPPKPALSRQAAG